MSMMLYKDFISDINENPVKDVSDETVQSAIYDWFKYRYIGFENTDKFLDILQRNVKVNYPIYQQKLRIEPGVSQYDWFVSMYRERQFKTKGEGNRKITYGGITSETKNESGTNVKTGGMDSVKSGSDTNIKSGSQDSVKTGADTNVKTGGQNVVRSGSESDSGTSAKSDVKTGSIDETKTGGHSSENIAGQHITTVSPHVSKVTTHGGHISNWSGDTQVQANLPMSKSYSYQQESIDLPEGQTVENTDNFFKSRAYRGMPSTTEAEPHNAKLNWSTVSNQAQSGHRDYNVDKSTVTESYQYGDGVSGDITTTIGDSNNPDKETVTYNNEKKTTDYNNVTDSETGNTSGNHVYNNVTDSTTYNSVTDKHTYDDIKDVVTYNNVTDNHTYNDVKDSVTYKNITDTENSKSDGNVTHSGNDNINDNNNRTDTEQVSGRNEDPATLLKRATSFIERSSAWIWYREQLECCFYPGFYTDDEEGSCLI